MSSIRSRLFFILIAATSVLWLCAVGWIYFYTKRDLERVLDTRLMEAARMVSSLVTSGEISLASSAAAHTELPDLEPDAGYERQLSCQIWSFDGRLLGRSSGAPERALSDQLEGFSEREVGSEAWRVFAVVDRDKGVRVLVGDRLGLRDRLVTDLIAGVLLPAVLILPALAILIWTSVGRGLRPLRLVTERLKRRGADDLSPLDPGRAGSEILPAVDALNGLFGKVAAARQHERDFTAFAAHELRTPLAGLRAQAQIALAAPETVVREQALRQVLVAVNRTSRLVRQLMAISQLDASAQTLQDDTIDVGAAIEDVSRRLESSAPAVRADIDPALRGVSLRMNREQFDLAVRNLHENALQHSLSSGTVRWLLGGSSPLVVAIEDDGPGIPEDELELVTERFYRGRREGGAGSGLGLSIVAAALGQVGAKLRLTNRPSGQGLRAEMVFPAGS